MDQLYLLWFLSISMLIGSFLSGLVPMALKLSDSKSRLLALLGSGILVGTALAIIIPEGIDSLYGQQSQPLIVNNQFEQVDTPTSVGKDHETLTEQALDRSTKMNKTWTIGISLVVGFILMLLIDQFTLFQASRDVNRFDDQAELTNHPQNYDYAQVSQDDDIVEDGSRINKELNTSDTELVNGVEVNRKIPRNSETSTSTAATTAAVTTNNYHTNVQMNNPGPNRYYDHSRSASHNRTKATKVTPTLGLVIHAAADGIALGAAATTSHRDVEMIIFLAIMLHKAPAAFSLVVLLLHRGLKYSTIRKHLLAFSLSAPIAAIVTYFGLSQSGKEALRKNNATGIAMLFSAGTFLFVATVHVLPELIHNKLLSPKEMLFLVGGAFLPLLLAQTI